jgi:hypothetical protein
LRREGLKVILRRPLTYAAIHLRTTLNVFLPGATDVLEVAGATAGRRGTLGVLQREGVLAAVRHYFGGAMWALWVCVPMLLIEGAKYLAALAGLLARVRRRMNRPLWLILLAGACLVLLPGPPAHARFRVPVEPLLSLAAGAGVVWLARKIRKGPAPRA